MNTESVKVCNVELECLADIAACWDDINMVLTEYTNLLDDICEKTVKSGQIHDSISRLHDYAAKYNEYADGLGKTVSKTVKGFVGKIADIDLELYKEI